MLTQHFIVVKSILGLTLKPTREKKHGLNSTYLAFIGTLCQAGGWDGLSSMINMVHLRVRQVIACP